MLTGLLISNPASHVEKCKTVLFGWEKKDKKKKKKKKNPPYLELRVTHSLMRAFVDTFISIMCCNQEGQLLAFLSYLPLTKLCVVGDWPLRGNLSFPLSKGR